MYLTYEVWECVLSFLIPSLPYCTVPVKQHQCSVHVCIWCAACILLISTLGKNGRIMQRHYCASPSCFSEKSLFLAEARWPEFEASITVSFFLLSTLICTDPPTANSEESFEQNNNSEALNTVENRCLHEDFVALLPVTCNPLVLELSK